MNLIALSFQRLLARLVKFYAHADSPMDVLYPPDSVPTKAPSGAALLGFRDRAARCFSRPIDPLRLRPIDIAADLKGSRNLVLNDVLSTSEDIWQLLRDLSRVMAIDGRLFIVHTNYLWSPLIRLWRRFFTRNVAERSWLSANDLRNLLSLNGFEIVNLDSGLLLPVYIPGVDLLVNRFIGQLPLIRALNLVQFFVVRRRPGFVHRRIEDLRESVSLIIPTKDERGNIRECFEKMPQLGSRTELVFVDGQSQDGTVEEIERFAARYGDRFDIQIHHQTGKGKGNAVWQGIEASTGDIVFIFDSDITVRCEDLPKFVLALTEGEADFVMGSRLVYPMEGQAMRTLNIIGNKFFAGAFSWLLNRRIKDTLCGTKGTYRKFFDWIRDGRDYFGDFDPFGDFDFIFGAVRTNLKIVEIPIRYRDRSYGDIKISRFTHGWLLLKMTLFASRKIRFR